ncbi:MULTISPECIES: hypothetical protein [Shinella]|uniref:Uncharacterized protein n=1 Tax=Shinella sumterensis TaxID=1967501 RepID=A0AA50CUD9_9HYPH|nr:MULTISPECIES: hypothetical protein [Shinella]MDC7259483.1 hypothetical protein [Shinella sp. YE25]WLS00780.1 hypothetical protein Q9313_24800 [Shinella sumterensis]CAI0341251.1 hypothetical protein SHINE37_70056 [Rhizobiaceae bacterium]CAK7260891.1 protein of unknown function [Shinella sp. WSC3-e]
MKTIADVIAELTTAAEEVHTLTESEKLRLLSRAYVTIKEGWELVGEPTRLQEALRRWTLSEPATCRFNSMTTR